MTTFNQTRLGNSITVLGGIDPTTGQPPVAKTLLLEANLMDLTTQLPIAYLGYGPWVFVVSITTTWPTFGPTDYPTNPLKLRFAMGSGGASHILEIDAVGGAGVQVPTAVCRVDVFWDRLPVNVGPIPRWVIPTSVVVTGTLHRAHIVPHARRSFITPLGGIGAGVAPGGAIPPFAKDWMVYAPQAAPVYGAGGNMAMLTFTGGAIHGITGPQMLAALVTGGRFPVPPGAERWQLIVPAPASDPTVVDFAVGF